MIYELELNDCYQALYDNMEELAVVSQNHREYLNGNFYTNYEDYKEDCPCCILREYIDKREDNFANTIYDDFIEYHYDSFYGRCKHDFPQEPYEKMLELLKDCNVDDKLKEMFARGVCYSMITRIRNLIREENLLYKRIMEERRERYE